MDNRKCNLDFDFTPIGQAIKKARNTEHMTRENLAELLDYSVRHVQSIETMGSFQAFSYYFSSPDDFISHLTSSFSQRKNGKKFYTQTGRCPA